MILLLLYVNKCVKIWREVMFVIVFMVIEKLGEFVKVKKILFYGMKYLNVFWLVLIENVGYFWWFLIYRY